MSPTVCGCVCSWFASGRVCVYVALCRQFNSILEVGSRTFDRNLDLPVSVLTSENRTNWAKVSRLLGADVTLDGVVLHHSHKNNGNHCCSLVALQAREYMIALDAKNADSIRTIETALFVICLEDVHTHDIEDLARLTLHGNGCNKWFDKPMNLIVGSNGRCALNGEVRRTPSSVFGASLTACRCNAMQPWS